MLNLTSLWNRLGAAVFLVLLPLLGWGQTISPGGAPVTQNFNAMGGTGTATLPTGWKADKSTTVRVVGVYSAAVLATEQAGAAAMTTTATNGIYNFTSATASDQAIGGLASSTNSKSVNLYSPKLTNSGATSVTGFTITYNVEKYRKGSNAAGFAIQMYYSTDGSTWTSAGSNFLTTFAADADNTGYATVPGATVAVTSQSLPVAVAAGADIYFAWNYSVASAATTSNAQALGVDDISLSPLGAGATPTLAATPATTAFTYVAGSGPSAEQSYSLSGSNLTAGPIVVTAPTSYEVCLTSGGTFTAAVSVAYTAPTLAGTNVFVRLQSGLSAASYTGNVTNVGGGATLNVAVSGSVTAPAPPTITTSVATRTGFTYAQGSGPSASQTYNVSGSALTPAAGDLTVTGPADYEVSLSSGSGYAASVLVPYTGGALAATPIFVRLKAGLAQAAYNGQLVAHSGGGAPAVNVTVSGSVTAPAAAVLTVSPTALTGFGYVLGAGPSASQNYNLSGANLTGAPGNLTVTAPAAYEVSADDVTFGATASIAYAGATLAATPVYVRLKAGLAAGSYNAQLVANSGGGAAVVKNVTVSGAVTAAATATLTVSPSTRTGFLYTVGSGPSAAQSYNLSGTTLTPAADNLTVTGPADYEVSTDGVTFGATATVAYTGGTLAATPIFVRLKTGLAVGSYNAQLVANSGGGAATKNVTVSGAVSAAGGACISEGFGTAATSLPANFTFTGIAAGNVYTSDFGVSAPSLKFDASGDAVVTPTVSNPTALSFWIKGQGTMTGSSFLIEGFNGAAYTTIDNITTIPTTGTVKTYSGLSNTFISIRFKYTKGSGNVAFDDVTVNCGVGTPTVTATPATLGLGTTGVGVAGSPQSFNVSASDLTAALVVTAPAGTEVSLSTASASFGASVSIAPTGGAVSTRPVFVRLAAQAAGSVSGTVALASGATTASVAVSGTVAAGSVFYYDGTGGLDDFTNYGLNADGTGTNPGSFVGAGFTYVVTGTAGTLAANWTVSGAGSKVVLTAGATLTIPTGFTFTGPLQQDANSTLVILNTSAGAISGITQLAQDPTSTIDLAQAGSYTIPTTLAYQNLKLTNGSKVFGSNFAAAISVNGTLTFSNTQVGGSTLNATGTSAANYSGVKLAGDLVQLAGTTYDAARSFTLQLTSTTTTQTIYGNGFGPVQVYRLLDGGTSTIPPAAASTSNTLANAQQVILSGVAYGTSTPAATVLTVANLFTGGVLLANQFSSLTLNDNTTLRFLLNGGGNFFTGHRGRLRLIDGCNLEFNRATTSTFLLGNLFIDPSLNTCRTLLLNSTAGGGANTLTLLGDLNVTGLVTLANGTLVIGANTLNLTGTLSASTGGFLNGSITSNLTIGGTGAFGSLAFNTGFQQLRNLVLNRAPSGGVAATLTLDAPLTVVNTLDLSAGIVATTATNLLTLDYNATGGLLNGSAGSYVNGPLARGTAPGAATVLFPIGKGTAYRPLTLNTATQTSSTAFTGEVLAGSARSTAVTAPLTRVSAVRYFRLDPAVQPTGYSGTVTLSFDTDDLVNYPADPTFVMAKRPTAAGGPWANIGRTGATSTGAGLYKAGTLESGPITSFSEFSLASTAPASNNAAGTLNPLPVELTAFTAVRTAASTVALAWNTASERNTARFEVERSTDGKAFARLGEVAAQGNKATPTTYAYLDANARIPAYSGSLYYRLRQVDADGIFAYSVVRVVAASGSSLVVYPNPASTVLHLATAPEARYRVLSLTGQVLLSGTAATGQADVAVASLPAGLYLVEVTTATGRQTQKFTKE